MADINQNHPGWASRKATASPKHQNGGWGEARHETNNVNVRQASALITPAELKNEIPTTTASYRTIIESRETIKAILNGTDSRLLAIVGPCSIHDEKAALEYAEKLNELAAEVRDRLYVVMRVYFEKPRTTIGWKGLINDPHLDGSFQMESGLKKARRLLLDITGMGLPTGTEMLDPITPQYIADLISWTAIGARTTESQSHREMASGLSMPVGFKNSTDGNLQIAVDAMKSSQHSHSFLGVDDEGRTAMISTRGNPWAHVILRGGTKGPNFSKENVDAAEDTLRKAGLPPSIMIDCSHANSGKKYENQEIAWMNVIRQSIEGSTCIVGLMLESNLFEGNQPFCPNPMLLEYGVSITDECVGWEKTESLIRWAWNELAEVL